MIDDNFRVIHLELQKYSQIHGDFMPWHSTRDPYQWFIAEFLLKLTTRKVVMEIYKPIVNRFSSFESLSQSSISELSQYINKGGLQNQRAKQLMEVSKEIVSTYGGDLPEDPQDLISLPGVGKYITDALSLHVFDKPVFPKDSNIQRLFRRWFDLPIVQQSRANDPYKDPLLTEICQKLIDESTIDQLKLLHLGSLDLAWKICRYLPKCWQCPFNLTCLYYLHISIEL